MTAKPIPEDYADAAALLLAEGWDPQEVTLTAVVTRALDGWLRRQVEAAIAHHAATCGNGHQEADRCESWYALQDALTVMHEGSHWFVSDLLASAETLEER